MQNSTSVSIGAGSASALSKPRHLREVSENSGDKLISEERAMAILQRYFHEIDTHKDKGSPKDIMRSTLGFSIKRSQSQISGTGVYISSGKTRQGDLVAIYPGTVYQVHEPIFFQSIANPFIFRCIDGVLIDGNDTGLSKAIYGSCHYRDVIGDIFTSDLSWLTSTPTNLLAIGQYVNNATNEYPANVAYQELNLLSEFPLNYMKYLPNVNYTFKAYKSDKLHIRLVVLIALRNIVQGEELISSYFTLVH